MNEMREILRVFRNKRILVTGANGFIGSHLIKALSLHGAEVGAIVRKPTELPSVSAIYIGDLKDSAFVHRCVKKCDPQIIFHLAAYKERTPELSAFLTAIDNNLIGSLHLFAAAKKLRNLCSVIVIGTAEEYGHSDCPFVENMRESPVNAYSFSKSCVTLLCDVLHTVHKIPCTIIRPTLAYGPGQDTDMFLPALIDSVIKNKPFPMTLGEQTRDFVYVSDVVEALLKAVEYEESKGTIINIGSGHAVKIAKVAMMVEDLLGKSGLIQIGKLEYREGEIMEYVVDNTKAREVLDWKPLVGLEEGLKHTIEYFVDKLDG